jgi:hypothetical protein
MTFQARQGDVFVERVPARKPAGPQIGTEHSVILANGEATGHAHRVIAVDQGSDDRPAAQLFEETNGRRFLVVERSCLLTHEEHRPIALAPGSYRITLQREYEPEGIKRVAD